MTKSTTFIQRIYEPSYDSEKISLFSKRYFISAFIFFTFHIFHSYPILVINKVTIFELLFLAYAILLVYLSRREVANSSIQFYKLWFDLLFLVIFEYFALSLFGIHSWLCVLFIFSVLYCSYWFSNWFALLFTTLVSTIYFIFQLNFDKYQLFSSREQFSIVFSYIFIYYFVALSSIFRKRKIRNEKIYDLKHEIEYVRSLLRSSFNSIIAVNTREIITEANDKTLVQLGYHRSELVDKIKFSSLFSPEEAKNILLELRKSENGMIENFETYIMNKSHIKIPIILSAAFLFDRTSTFQKELEKRKKLSYVIYFRDIRFEKALSIVSHEFTIIQNEKKLLDKLCNIIAETIQAETCQILTYNENKQLLELSSSYGVPKILKKTKGEEIYIENEGMTGRVFHKGITLNIQNIDTANRKAGDVSVRWDYAENFKKYSRFNEFKHFLGTPLIIQNEIYGVIRVLNKYSSFTNMLDENGFSQHDQEILEQISVQISTLIEKTKNKERFNIISTIGKEINDRISTHLDELLDYIAKEVVSGMKYKACTLRLIENDNILKMRGCFGFKSIRKDDSNYDMFIGQGISGVVAENGVVVQINDLSFEKSYFFPQALDKEHLKSMLCIPLKHGLKVIGIINCYMSRSHYFSDEEIQIMQTFANYTAIAIQNRLLFDDANQKTKTVSNLHATTGALLFEHDLNNLLNKIVTYAGNELKADLVILYEYIEREDDFRIPPIVYGKLYKADLSAKGLVSPHRESIIFEMLSRKEPFYADDAEKDWVDAGLIAKEKIKSGKSFIIQENIKSSAGIPLIFGNNLIGILFINYKSKIQFNDSLKTIIEIFANQAAVAIENSRLYKKTQESEALYRSLLDNLPLLLFRKDRNSKFISANDAFCKSVGLSYKELIGKDDYSFYPTEQAFQYINDDQWVIKEGKKLEKEELHIFPKDKKPRWVNVIKTPVYDSPSKDNVTGVQAIFWDITEQKRVRERYRSLFVQSPDAIIVHRDGKITLANPAALKLFGVKSEKELLSKSIYNFIHHEDITRVKNRLHNMLSGDTQEKSIELKIRNIDGEPIDVEVCSRLSDLEDEIQVVLHDLRKTKAILREVHHRVRRSLTEVSSHLELEEYDTTSTEVRQVFTTMRNRIQAMALIHTILYRSRDDSNVNMQIYFKELTDAIFDAYNVNASQINITIKASNILLDTQKATACGLIVNELVENSILHAFGGKKGRINVSLIIDKQLCVLTVSDDGKGLKRYLRPPSDSKGLKLVESLAENQLRGAIKPINRKGLTIQITFPRY
ncbi:MAG: GAF domain-containing protein [Candidatus Delongbacteria bacterium]|nr:GAF domain-containing protein [Candidatus Delongbacteria bacterium]